MTDEELKGEIQEVSASLKNIPESDKSLSKEELRHKRMLLLKKDTLEKIKAAKENNQKHEELQNSMFYGLLTTWGEKHPYLASLVSANFKWNMF